MKKDWYIDWFSNKLYLELYKHRDEKEANDLVNLIQRSINLKIGDKVLDVCCGAGRHSVEFAKRGFDVTGFDLSGYLIGEAKKLKSHAKEKKLKLKFQIKDMRNFDFKNSFNLALNVFSSFGYFESDEENFKVFKNVNSSLKRNGFLIFDFLNESYLRKNLVKQDSAVINGKKITQKRRIENDFVFKDIKIGKNIFTERVKLYSVNDIKKELEKTGFKIRFVFGDYYGSRFMIKESKRFIIIAEKN